MKTSELTGPALDWAIAKITNPQWWVNCPDEMNSPGWENMDDETVYSPSTNWSQGGPIIEREGISLSFESIWIAAIFQNDVIGWAFHEDHESNPLIAAMRCFVASKLGDEIEIPEELL